MRHAHHLEHGLTALRHLKALALGRGDRKAAIAYAQARDDWGTDQATVVQALKAAVSGIDTGDIGGGSVTATDLSAAVRPLSIVGRLPLRQLPARVPYMTQTGPARAYWIGESRAMKMSAGTYVRDPVGLVPKMVGALTVATREMLDDPSIAGEQALRADLVAACVEAMDRAFIDRTNTGSADVPAAINASVTPIPSTGSTLADLDADFAMAVRQLSDAGSDLRNAYWVMPSYFAARLALTRGIDGGPAYPKLGALGGELAGLPVITSAAAEAEVNSDDFADVTLLDASQVDFAEGPAQLRTSTEATIEMSNSPSGAADTPTAASASLVSMYAADCVALMAAFRVTWRVRRAGMVQVVSNVPAVLES